MSCCYEISSEGLGNAKQTKQFAFLDFTCQKNSLRVIFQLQIVDPDGSKPILVFTFGV